jgi:hypothetical protein
VNLSARRNVRLCTIAHVRQARALAAKPEQSRK